MVAEQQHVAQKWPEGRFCRAFLKLLKPKVLQGQRTHAHAYACKHTHSERDQSRKIRQRLYTKSSHSETILRQMCVWVMVCSQFDSLLQQKWMLLLSKVLLSQKQHSGDKIMIWKFPLRPRCATKFLVLFPGRTHLISREADKLQQLQRPRGQHWDHLREEDTVNLASNWLSVPHTS